MSAPLRAVVAFLTCCFAPPVALALGGPRWLAVAWLIVPVVGLLSAFGVSGGVLPVATFLPIGWAIALAWLAAIVASVALAWAHPSQLRWGRGLAMTGAYVVGSGGLALASLWIARTTVIDTSGMQPTLHAGDRVVLAGPLLMGDVERGDVVQFNPPDQRTRWVRRVVALEGDRVSVEAGVLRVSGADVPGERSEVGQRLSPENCSVKPVDERVMTYGEREVRIRHGGRSAPEGVVPPGHVYLLGDDRSKSLDSRHVGPVPLSHVRARVLGVGLPAMACGAADWSRIGGW